MIIITAVIAYELHCVSKNVPLAIDIHDPIAIIFGRSVIEKVRNQTMLCFPPHPSSTSALPCERGKPEDSAVRTGALCVQHSPTSAALSTSFLLNHALPKASS